MSPPDDGADSWVDFARELAEYMGVAPERIAREAPLVDQLELDSLALTELTVCLLDAYPRSRFARNLEARNWDAVTADQLFKDCRAER